MTHPEGWATFSGKILWKRTSIIIIYTYFNWPFNNVNHWRQRWALPLEPNYTWSEWKWLKCLPFCLLKKKEEAGMEISGPLIFCSFALSIRFVASLYHFTLNSEQQKPVPDKCLKEVIPLLVKCLIFITITWCMKYKLQLVATIVGQVGIVLDIIQHTSLAAWTWPKLMLSK